MTRIRLLWAPIVVWLGVCLPALSHATTRYAWGTGGSGTCTSAESPCSITNALNALQSGDTLQLLGSAGPISGPILLESAHNNTTIRGNPDVLLIPGAEVGGTLLILALGEGSSGITIDGQGMVLDGQSATFCNVCYNGSDHVLRNYESRFAGAHGHYGNATNLRLENLNVHHSGVDADRQRVRACWENVGGPPNPNEHGHCHGIYGGFADRTDGPTFIIGGEWHRNDGFGIHVYDHNLTVDGASVHDNGTNGTATLGNHVIYRNNVLYGNGWSGNGCALNLGAPDVVAYNNTIVRNNEGICGPEATAVRNNIVFDNAGGNITTGSIGSLSTNLCGGSGGTSNCQLTTGDPQFANAPSHDYHLLSGSPAVNAGDDLSGTGFTTDKDGRQRGIGGAWDIGAYEFGATGCGAPPEEVVFAVNAGGPEYITAACEVYDADAAFSGGSTYTTTAAIAGTVDDGLYQSERYGNFSYNIPLENGDYEVTLKFAEIYWTTAGQRVFNVLIEGQTVISNLDLVATVGPNTAYDVVVPVTVADGILNVIFQTVVDNAKVSAIKVAWW